MRKLVHIDDNGFIDGTSVVESGAENEPASAGWYDVDPDTDLSDKMGRSFVPQTSEILDESRPAPVSRLISRDDFIDRITVAEGARLRMLAADESVPAEARATIAEFSARIFARVKPIDLDDARFVQGWALCKSVGLWPDEATADARIAEIMQ